MSGSQHTLPPEIYARRHFPVDDDGRPRFPPVVRRRPRNGDVHPIERKALRRLLLLVPLEYLFGLKKIELLPRVGQIGEPYGFYSPSEKRIVLYSVPLVWEFPHPRDEEEPPWTGELKAHEAAVTVDRDVVRVEWHDPLDLEKFFYWEVVLHELGHHYSYQWKRKKKPPPWGKYQELIAELHREKLSERLVKRYLKVLVDRKDRATKEAATGSEGAADTDG